MSRSDEDRPLSIDEAKAEIEKEAQVDNEPEYNLYTGRDKKNIDHVKTASAMVKFINCVPMSPEIKKIMVLRIGNPLTKKSEMTHLAIALQLGMREEEVFQLERIGIEKVSKYMERTTIQDGINSFNKDSKNVKKTRSTLLD